MSDELMTAFDESLDALAAGERLDAILARYPHLAAELRPMLAAAETARQHVQAAPVPHAAQMSSRTQFLTRAAELRGRRRTAGGWLGLAALKGWAMANRAAAITVAFVLGFALGSYGVITASAQSLPGEPLYPVKRTLEQTQLLLSFDPRARERLETDFSERRVDEVESLLAAARRAQVTFGGVLERIEGERWWVAGIQLIVPGSAEVVGTPFPGLYVAVNGVSQSDGTVVVTRVEVTGLAFSGRVRSLAAGTWQVDTTILMVNADTVITGSPAVGDLVNVTARRQSDGSWLALRIDLSASGPALTPVPGATLAPPGQEVRFTGLVESQGPASWQISGQAVQLTALTEIRDNPQVGQRVEVRAVRAADGTLTALRIERDEDGPSATPTPGSSSGPDPAATDDHGEDDDSGDDDDDSGSGGPGPSASHTPQPAETDAPDDDDGGQEQRWEGTLEAASGSIWVIAGQAVTVTPSTEVRDNPQPGDQVEVRAVPLADGTLVAVRIEKK
jgi:hypothetical protein